MYASFSTRLCPRRQHQPDFGRLTRQIDQVMQPAIADRVIVESDKLAVKIENPTVSVPAFLVYRICAIGSVGPIHGPRSCIPVRDDGSHVPIQTAVWGIVCHPPLPACRKTALMSTMDDSHGSSWNRRIVPFFTGWDRQFTSVGALVQPSLVIVTILPLERIVTSRGARQNMPTPAGSSLCSQASSQPDPPRSRSLAKSLMPWPLSLTVTQPSIVRDGHFRGTGPPGVLQEFDDPAIQGAGEEPVGLGQQPLVYTCLYGFHLITSFFFFQKT